MGRQEIIEQKLGPFLNTHSPFTEECQVVYALVEIRKLLDRDSNKKYPILRFYSNWSVHTDKDSTDEMREIMSEIYHGIEKEVANPALRDKKTKIISFMYMEDLQEEMKKFLQEYSLPYSLTEKNSWLEFVKTLIKVLVDQPINNPSIDIKRFSFLPASDGCVRGRIDFNKNVGGNTYYEFGNTY